ncbi:MAG: hypothetical protein JSS77_06850 [Acidobacteria bacterium]|nr:hypothetical protein [Acidobacteriota bacterium]
MKAGASLIFLLLAVFAAMGQEYPDRIDGYKVHKKPIVINSVERKDSKKDVDFVLNTPTFAGASLTAVKFKFAAALSSDRAAKIEKIRFYGLTVNGIAVKIDEFDRAFDLKADELVTLPEPFAGEVSSFGVAKGAWLELTTPKKEWVVKGKAYIFGRFKKFGMTFRRAIPVEFDLSVKNPIPSVLAVKFHPPGLKWRFT